MTIAELRKKRAAAYDSFKALATKEALTPEEQKSYPDQKAAVAELDNAIQRALDDQELAAREAVLVPGQATAGAIIEPRYRRDGRLTAFRGPNAERDAYRVGMWVKATLLGQQPAQEWCRDNGILIRAQSEGVNSAGGFLVPEEMMNSIIDLREQFGVFRQQARVVPMGRDTLNWPRRTGGLTAYFIGENSAPTESAAAWDNVNLTAKKVGTLTRFSTEIDQDAIISIGDWLTAEISYAFASKEDDCGFNGDGTSLYGGIRGLTQLAIDGNHNAGKYTSASGHNTFALLDATDLTGVMGLLPYYALRNAKFYCSQLAFATLFERLIATAGGNSVNTLDGSIVYRYLGFPIVIAQKLPAISTTLTGKAMLFFGDLSLAAAMGERRGVTIMRSEHRYMDQDQIALLGTERFDINVHDMGDNVNAGPLVSLVAP